MNLETFAASHPNFPIHVGAWLAWSWLTTCVILGFHSVVKAIWEVRDSIDKLRKGE